MSELEYRYWWGFCDALEIALRDMSEEELKALLKQARQKKDRERIVA